MKKIFYLFSKLTDGDVDWIAAHGAASVLAPGAELIREGTPNTAVFIVLEGSMVVKTRATGQVGRVDVGEVLGEMSLVDGRTASATVQATGAARVIGVPRAELEAHLTRDIGFSSRFFRGVAMTLSERMRALDGMRDAGEALDELPDGMLEDVHMAGARFDRLLKATLARGR